MFRSPRAAIAPLILAIYALCAASAVAAPGPSAPPVRPAITGSAVDGQTLSASTGDWTVPAQDLSFAYQWKTCNPDFTSICSDISGATSSTLFLTPAQVGLKIKVTVTADDGSGTASQTSLLTGPVNALYPQNTVAPSITGSAVEGETLAVDTGTWTGTPVITFSYSWLRCNSAGVACVTISGATASTYVATSADVGKRLKVSMGGHNGGGTSGASTAASAIVAGGAPPSAIFYPEITGETVEGETLATTNGTWDGLDPITYTYQWVRCDNAGQNCLDISGATAQTYTIPSADVGYTLTARVTAENSRGAHGVTTDPVVGPVTAIPPDPNLPVISGITTEGQTLQTSDGLWPDLPTNLTYTYYWESCNADGLECVSIAEASNHLVLGASHVGGRIRVFVLATDGEVSQSQTSALTAVIEPAAPPEPTPPIITGTAIDGATLSASDGTWAEPNSELTFTYQWQRCDPLQADDCADISGANGSTLLLSPTEVSFKIQVVVTADNGEGTTSQTSALAGPVDALSPASEGTPTITGDLVNGSTVTADPGTWTGTPEITFAYQWYRCDSDGANCMAMAGATASTYELTGAEVGGTLMYGLAVSNPGGSAETSSEISGVVTNMAPPTIDTYPEVAGEAVEGSTLAVTTGTWASSGSVIYSYEWLRCDHAGTNCDGIVGAIEHTYLVTAQDIGHTLTARVHAINGGGSTGAMAQPPLGPVVGRPVPTPEPLPEPPTGPPIDLTPARLSLEVRTPSQTMERAEFEFTLPQAGRGTVTGTVVDDTRHRGAEHAHRTPQGKPYTAFSRSFASSKPGKLVLPATLGPRALDRLRQRGFLRVTVTTKFTPAGSKLAQVYKKIVRLRPFAVTDYAASIDEGVVTATLRTPRAGHLAVSFLLRDRLTGVSSTVKSFAPRELAAGDHVYSAPLTSRTRRAISSGQVRLMVKARLDTNLYSARMLRSRYIRISNSVPSD